MDEFQHIKETFFSHLNCRSLLPIIDQIRAVFQTSNPVILAATKTWLNDTVIDMEVNINGYRIEWKDRSTHEDE